VIVAESDDFARLIEPLARQFFGEPNRRRSSKTDLRFGKHGSLSIDLEKGTWFDHESKEGGGALDLVMRAKGFSETRDAIAWLEAEGYLNGRHPPRGSGAGRLGTEVAHYDYVDEAGNLVLQVVRFEPKDFRQRRPDGKGGWVWSIAGVRLVPYRLPELMEQLALDRMVFVVEGEKDADNLINLGVPATTNPMGAGKWRSSLNQYFVDADVVVISDNDPQMTNKAGVPQFHPDGRPKHAGQDHAEMVCAELAGVAARVRHLNLGKLWRNCPPKGDITDWINAGGTIELLYEVAEGVPTWSPDAPADVHQPVPLVRAFPIDGAAIPLRDWITPGLLLRRHVTVLVAPPGIGKSLLTLQVGMAASAGMEWAGWKPRKRPRVMLINSEDDNDEMRRRMYAAQSVMGIDDELLTEIYFADAPERIVVAKADAKTKTVTRTPMADRIVATIQANAIDVLIVDPFAETFEGDENDNSELKWAAVLWRDIARRTNCAVLLVHHTKKYTGSDKGAGDADAARGGGALVGVARIVSTLFSMSEADAKRLGVEIEKRNNYLRFDDAKANLTLVTFASRWFEKRTFTLPNATADIPADEVGVLVPWKPPRLLDQLDTATIWKILDVLDRGTIADNGEPIGDPYCLVNAGKTKRWAGHVIKRYLPQAEDAAIKKQILDVWIESGLLVEFEAPVSNSKGDPRACLRVDNSKRPGRTTEDA
jgi:hypothetical protein